MVTNRDNLANQSLNSRTLGVFIFLAGVIVTFGTYGFGVIIGLPMMLMGIAFPLWRNSVRNNNDVPLNARNAAEMSQARAFRSGGVVMSRDEAASVANAAHEETRQARRVLTVD